MQGRLRHSGSRFAAMVLSAAFGSFNENFFKEAAVLVAIAEGRSYLQGYGTIVFTLPFLILAAPAGWLADRFSKRNVIIGIKLFEVGAMSTGAYGLYTGNWTLIFIMASLMATQGVIFSPAINGTIPELFPDEYVPKANAIMTIAGLSAILGGVAVGGFALGRKTGAWNPGSHGRMVVMLIAITVTVLGFLSSLGVPGFPSASPQKKFPWRGPADTVAKLIDFRNDRMLAAAVAANVFVYMIGSLQIQVINQFGLWQLHAGGLGTGLMVVAQLIGFGIGGFASGLIAKGAGWHRALPIGTGTMAVSMGLVSSIPFAFNNSMLVFILLFVAAGAGGGLVLIAGKSFIQVRASYDIRGTVLSSVNFAIFGGILITGPVANLLNKYILPTTSYGILGAACLPASALLYFFFKRHTN